MVTFMNIGVYVILFPIAGGTLWNIDFLPTYKWRHLSELGGTSS